MSQSASDRRLLLGKRYLRLASAETRIHVARGNSQRVEVRPLEQGQIEVCAALNSSQRLHAAWNGVAGCLQVGQENQSNDALRPFPGHEREYAGQDVLQVGVGPDHR